MLKMDERDRLAANCPRCFGPPTNATSPGEPDIIVALDGNFSHKRMKTASVPITDMTPETPELFMEPARVEEMASQGPSCTSKPPASELVAC